MSLRLLQDYKESSKVSNNAKTIKITIQAVYATYICHCVVAIVAVAPLAIQFTSKTFAIEFEALRLFAIAWIPPYLFDWRRTARSRSLTSRSCSLGHWR